MYHGIKRYIDIFTALAIIIVLFPLFSVLFLLLTILNKGKPLFIQDRPGKDGRIFRLFKFRTMTDKHDSEGNLLPDSDRLTRIGSLIRALSLDELPQMVNILRGDMSLIGPRPLLSEYLLLYNKRQHRRHEVRPGLTGWAQVNGRNTLSWEEKFEMDVWYVDNLSFKLDFKIFILTIQKVIRREGISSSCAVTMEKFTGIM